jgi:multiple antibiotic resistance protein
MQDALLSAFITFFVVVDPVGLVPLFAALTRTTAPGRRWRVAWRGVAIGGVILFCFAAVGQGLLTALGVGLPAFQIAGGVLLFLLAMDMVFARHSGLRDTTDPEREEAAHSADISVFPLAIPLIAGPGALTSVLLHVGRGVGDPLRIAGVLGMLAFVLLLTLLALRLALPLMRLLGVTGTNVVSRVLGVVAAALGVQFVLDGLSASGLLAGLG